MDFLTLQAQTMQLSKKEQTKSIENAEKRLTLVFLPL